MLLWNWSHWLLWIVRFYIVMLSSMYTTLRPRFLNIFFIRYSYMVLTAGELCPCVIMFICTCQASFCVVFSVIFGRWYTLSASGAAVLCSLCCALCVMGSHAVLFIVCCCWFVQCLLHSCVGLDLGSVCFCQFLSSPQPLFSMLVVLFIEDFFFCYSHLVMYYNGMIPQVSKLCFGNIISNSCTNISASVLQMGVPLGPPFSCS